MGSFVNVSGNPFRNQDLPFTLPCPYCGDWFTMFCGGVDDVNAESIACVSRGFWWNNPNVLGDVVPVGKKPKVGDDGVVK